MSDIQLSDRQSEAWHYLEDDVTTEVGYGGAAGGGKSWFGCVWHIYRRTTYPESRGLIGRAKLTVLKDSTRVTFFKVCKSMGYQQDIDYRFNASANEVVWWNGSVTLFRDLNYYPSDPDFTRLGSTEYTDVFVDEGTEITLKCFEILTSRIRWKIAEFAIKPKILLTCNPSPCWVKYRYISSAENVPVKLEPHQKFVHALVTDNPDEEFVRLYKEQLERLTSEYDKRRLLHGDWDAVREVQNQFAHQFDRDKHVNEDAVHDEKKRLFWSIDFNLSPLGIIFWHQWRDDSGEHFHVFDEMSIENSNIDKVIDNVARKYGVQVANCAMTGDAMGRQRQLSQKDNASYYMQIKRGLRLRDGQLTIKANPKHENSRSDVNYFLKHFPDFKINPKCVNLIRDLQYVECDAFGKILKSDRKNENQRADHLDTFRYAINSFQKGWINRHQKSAKSAIARLKGNS